MSVEPSGCLIEDSHPTPRFSIFAVLHSGKVTCPLYIDAGHRGCNEVWWQRGKDREIG